MRHDMTGLAIMAGRLGARTFLQHTYSPTGTRVTFGHLYDSLQDIPKQEVEALVWSAVYMEISSMLVAMDAQRLGSSTAAFVLPFSMGQLEFHYAFGEHGELRLNLAGRVFT